MPGDHIKRQTSRLTWRPLFWNTEQTTSADIITNPRTVENNIFSTIPSGIFTKTS